MNKIIGIAGAGLMGRGIAQIAAMAGWKVRIFEIDEKMLDDAKEHHIEIMNMLASKGKIKNKEVSSILSSIYYGNELSIFMDCSLIIEAIVENPSIKKRFYQDVKEVLDKETIVASNTSSLSITDLASAYEYPANFIGLHFFNPAPLMPLVEIIEAAQTSKKVIENIEKVVSEWGKIAVKAKDTPGFIVNKVARPYYSEALFILEERLATFVEIDEAMEAKGFRMGPFKLMDYIGNDVNYAVTESVWKGYYYEPRYQPSLSQLNLIRSGKLGRKSGEGYYKWSGNEPIIKKPKGEDTDKEWIFNRIIAMVVNEAADTIQKGICTENDLELAMKHGVNYPKGPLAWGKELGYDFIIKTLDDLFDHYHNPRYRVSSYLRKLANK